MLSFQKASFSTETSNSSVDLQFASRSGAVDEESPTVCGDYTLTVNCRVDIAGNALPFSIEVGNPVYVSYSGLTPFNGADLYYAIQLAILDIDETTYICQVSALGIVTNIFTTCTI